jgi:hypothetical protein
MWPDHEDKYADNNQQYFQDSRIVSSSRIANNIYR